MSVSKKRHLNQTNFILEKRYLNEACSLKPFPNRESNDYDSEMKYIAAAKKIVQTLTSSGEFNLIVENDGCGNYLQEVIDKYSGSYYYAPLSIKSDPIMGVYVDGAYNLDGFKSTGNVNCIISIKCGCGGKTEKVQINPNSSYSAIVSALNDTGIINIQ